MSAPIDRQPRKDSPEINAPQASTSRSTSEPLKGGALGGSFVTNVANPRLMLPSTTIPLVKSDQQEIRSRMQYVMNNLNVDENMAQRFCELSVNTGVKNEAFNLICSTIKPQSLTESVFPGYNNRDVQDVINFLVARPKRGNDLHQDILELNYTLDVQVLEKTLQASRLAAVAPAISEAPSTSAAASGAGRGSRTSEQLIEEFGRYKAMNEDMNSNDEDTLTAYFMSDKIPTEAKESLIRAMKNDSYLSYTKALSILGIH